MRKLQTPEANEKAARRDGNWAVSSGDGYSRLDRLQARELSKVLRDNHIGGTRQVLQFGVLRLADGEERADTSQVQAATSGAL